MRIADISNETLDEPLNPYYYVRKLLNVRSSRMVTATLTSKGQLTIPKIVRDSLHLHAGDRIAFVVHDDAQATMTPVKKSVDEVFGKLHQPGQRRRSEREMKAAVADRMRNRSR